MSLLQPSRLTRPKNWILLIAILLIIYLAGVPLVILVWGSLKSGNPLAGGPLTLDNFRHAFLEPGALPLIFNSLLYATGTCAMALFLGTALAFVIERTNTPFKYLFTGMALVPLIIPGMLHTIAWILLLSPKIGVINRLLESLLRLESAPFNIYSLGGMIWAEGLHLSPLVFVIMAAAFRNMDPSLEEAALASGATYAMTFRRITLRMSIPALASAGMIIFIRGLESFEVPAMIGLRGGVKVLTSRIWLALIEFPPSYGTAAAYAVGLLVISLLAILLYNRLVIKDKSYGTITGRGYRPYIIDLGKWRYATSAFFILYFVFLVGLPLLILLWTSFSPIYAVPSFEKLKDLTLDNYAFVFNMGRAWTAFVNSVFLSLGSGVFVTLITAVIAWITVKSGWRGRTALDAVTFLPITIPGIVLGVSLIWVYLILPIPIYGTVWILLLAFITQYLPYGIRTNSASMVQISSELEEAAAISGGSWFQVFRRITMPLLKPGLIAGFVYIVIVSFRELSSAILLYSSKSIVMSILIFDLWDGGQFTIVAALSILMIIFLVILVIFANRLGAMIGIRFDSGG